LRERVEGLRECCCVRGRVSMAKLAASQIRIRVEARFELQLKVVCERSEVREALEEIRADLEARWKAGRALSPLVGKPVRKAPDWLWDPHQVCRENGIVARVEVVKGKAPQVKVAFTAKGARAHLAARLVYPQNLLGAGDFDLFEISRHAPMSRIVEDLKVELEELRAERERRGAVIRRFGSAGSRTDVFLRAVEAYRRRSQGATWPELARDLKWSSAAMRRAVSNLCAATGLPSPKKGVVLPDRPDVDCDGCAMRTSPTTTCATCPLLAHFERCLELEGLPDLPKERPRD
jgi:hypothetical protein